MGPRYTCSDYRAEMIWLALQRRIADPFLADAERQRLQAEIQALEAAMEANCPRSGGD